MTGAGDNGLTSGDASRTVWLRVDIDTYLGARDGLPRLLESLDTHDARATFFASVGPDRWGRAVLRIVRRPGFLRKMLRTRAVRAYGLSTCLRGTLLPSIEIGKHLREPLRSVEGRGHEVGLHCWDHVLWQDELERLSESKIREQLDRGISAFETIYGHRPHCFAAPGWVSTPLALRVLDSLGFDWMSNSRGPDPFVPRLDGQELATIDLPTSISTLDEDLGRQGIDESNYVERLIEQIHCVATPLLVIHTETEGGHYRPLLETLLARCRDAGYTFRPLGELAARALAIRERLPRCDIAYGEIPGRSGKVTLQGIASATVAGRDEPGTAETAGA